MEHSEGPKKCLFKTFSRASAAHLQLTVLRRSTYFGCSFRQKSELAQALGVLIFWCFGLGSSARKHLPPPIVVVTVVSVHMFDWLHTEWPGLITCVSHIVLALCYHYFYLLVLLWVFPYLLRYLIWYFSV